MTRPSPGKSREHAEGRKENLQRSRQRIATPFGAATRVAEQVHEHPEQGAPFGRGNKELSQSARHLFGQAGEFLEGVGAARAAWTVFGGGGRARRDGARGGTADTAKAIALREAGDRGRIHHTR